MYSLKEQYGKFIIRNTCQSSDGYPYGTAHCAWIVKKMAHAVIYLIQLISKFK